MSGIKNQSRKPEKKSNFFQRNQISKRNNKGMSHLLPLKNGNSIRIDCLSAGIFRIRVGRDDCLHESGLNRYSIIQLNESELAADSVKVSEQDKGWVIDTPETELHVNAEIGKVSLKEKGGNVILEQPENGIDLEGVGFTIDFSLAKDEKLYGLGDVNRDCLQRRGKIYTMIQKNVVAYSPIPFIMSTRGWAIFMNSTWFHTVDAGAADPDVLRYAVDGGELDYYLIAGEYPKALLDRYTRITGRPALLPEWGYGLFYSSNYYEDLKTLRARDVLIEAYEFRRQDIPCDIWSITNWTEKPYDYSLEKKWDPKRFHTPSWLKSGDPGTFTAALKNMGYKLSLWLCCDYDLTVHEEKQLPDQVDLGRNGIRKADNSQVDEALIVDDQLRGAILSDRITKRGEPWFEHLKKFVDGGARVLFLDSSSTGLQHPDRKWFNGMDDTELHNFNCVIYSKQMHRGFLEYTGKRPMNHIANAYAGTQQYSAVWTGDTGGGAKPLTCLLNYGFCSLTNVGSDMDACTEQGIHFGFFQVITRIGSWSHPWYQSKHVEALFKYYDRLRYRLLPYIYSHAHVANKTGFPIVRAMPLVFPNDSKSNELLYQYMFGDAFLVSAFSESVHLPAGQWFNYWTGEQMEGPVTLPATYPEDRGGSLFVRAGAIIPMGPEGCNYWKEKPMDILTIDVFPGNREEPFVLYEDDGDTEAYKQGKIAATVFDQRLEDGKLTLSVSPRQGSYDGMPEQRKYRFEIHCRRPSEVRVGGMPVSDWRYDSEKSVLIIAPVTQPKNKTIDICIRRSL